MSSFERYEGDYRKRSPALPLFVLFILFVSALVSLSSDIMSSDEQGLPARTFAGPNPNTTVVLHLHYDNISADQRDLMNSYGPYPASVTDYDGDVQPGVTLNKQTPKNLSWTS